MQASTIASYAPCNDGTARLSKITKKAPLMADLTYVDLTYVAFQ